MSKGQITVETLRDPGKATDEMLRKLSKRVNLDTIPTGILHLRSPLASRLRQFDGGDDAPTADQYEWQRFQDEIAEGALPGHEVPNAVPILELAKTYWQDGQVPIALSFYDYHSVRPRFWSFLVRNQDASSDLVTPADGQIVAQQTAFAAAALLPQQFDAATMPVPFVHDGLSLRFIVPRGMLSTNHHTIPNDLRADFGDGHGFRPIAFDQPVDIQYPEAGAKEITLILGDGVEHMTAQATFEVASSNTPAADRHISLTATIKYKNQPEASGHFWIFYGSDNGIKHTDIVRPVIVAEGFPGSYTIQYLWDRLNQQSFATRLLAAGYDLVVLGFTDGTLAIQANAYLAIEAIKFIRDRPGRLHPLIVSGASMGGLITRYALCYMEKHGLDHASDRFFTIDTPHNGATVPVSVQVFLALWASHDTTSKHQWAMLSSVASRQMLLEFYHEKEGTIGPATERQDFVADLRSIGWMPKKVLTGGVVDGRGTGEPSSTPIGAKALNYECAACHWADLYTFPKGDTNNATICEIREDKMGQGFYKRVSFTGIGEGYDSCPGGVFGDGGIFNQIYNSLPKDIIRRNYVANGCFIPSASAAAVSNAGDNLYFPLIGVGTKFDLEKVAWNTGNTDLPHIQLNHALADFGMAFVTKPVAELRALPIDLVEELQMAS